MAIVFRVVRKQFSSVERQARVSSVKASDWMARVMMRGARQRGESCARKSMQRLQDGLHVGERLPNEIWP